LRLQEVIRLIFARFRQLGSARQVLLSITADRIHFPRPLGTRPEHHRPQRLDVIGKLDRGIGHARE
jgi:hypothetical protein